ncbi:MAG: glycosyltransferase [Nitrospinae bacterium]|nr:glycosyltransferase [Nitrospinota bacterium]
MESETSVTVLMPVYNAGKYLRGAIESILGQTHADFEFLIINDGSTDGSADVARSYNDSRIRFVENERNMGMVATLNRGLALATHELVARMDGDDISHPERLARQVERFCAPGGEKLALLGTMCRQIGPEGELIYMGAMEKPIDPLAVAWYQLFDNSFIHTSVMFRKSVVLGELGGYRWSDICADYDLWMRMIEKGLELRSLPQILVDYRNHPTSIIGEVRAEKKEKLETAARERREVAIRCAASVAGWTITGDEADILQGFIHGFDPQKAARFIATFETALQRFRAHNAQAAGIENFRLVVAEQYCTVAYKILAEDRALAARILMKGIGFHTPVALRLPWGRIASLALFGEKARKMFGKARAAARKALD